MHFFCHNMYKRYKVITSKARIADLARPKNAQRFAFLFLPAPYTLLQIGQFILLRFIIFLNSILAKLFFSKENEAMLIKR